jgi:hypothetical protein
MRNILLLGLVCILGPLATGAQVFINRVEDLDSLIRQKNYSVRNGRVELAKAQRAKLAGLIGIPDPTGNLALGYTNNTQLPVTVFPAEILGGTPGTYEKVAIGTKYNANASGYVDIKLLNLSGINNFRLSKINILVVETDNTIRIKDLYQQVSTLYYNILTLQTQRKATEQYIANADQLLKIVTSKLENGLASPQEQNDAQITKYNQEENLRQINFQLDEQINRLKALLDISDKEVVLVTGSANNVLAEPVTAMDARLRQQKAKLDYAFAKESLEKERNAFLPTVSFVFNYQTQWFDVKPNPFNSAQSWIPSNYFGLRLNVPIPGANQIGAYHNQKYQLDKSSLNAEQAAIQDELEASNLNIALNQVRSEHDNAQKVAGLRKLSYSRNVLNYEAGLVTLEYTINSLNTLVDADYAVIAAKHKVSLQEQLIKINNTIK